MEMPDTYWENKLKVYKIGLDVTDKFLQLAREYSLKTMYTKDVVMATIEDLLKFGFSVDGIKEKLLWVLKHSEEINTMPPAKEHLKKVIRQKAFSVGEDY